MERPKTTAPRRQKEPHWSGASVTVCFLREEMDFSPMAFRRGYRARRSRQMMISGTKKMSVPGRPKKAIDAPMIAAPKVKPILPPKEKTERLMPRFSSVETRLTMSAPCG